MDEVYSEPKVIYGAMTEISGVVVEGSVCSGCGSYDSNEGNICMGWERERDRPFFAHTLVGKGGAVDANGCMGR